MTGRLSVALVLFSNPSSGAIFVNPTPAITYDALANTDLIVNNLQIAATNVYNDLRFPAGNVSSPGVPNAPAEVILNTSIPVLQFTQNEIIYFNAQMSHDYWPNTTLRPHLHLSSTASTVTNVWEFRYSNADIGGVYPTPTLITFTNTTSGVNLEHELFNVGDMDGFATGVSGMSGCSLKLISNTTANLLEVDIHYRVKYLGGPEFNP